MANHHLIRFDWAVKRMLRNRANFAVLEGLLSVLLKDNIKIVNFGESESNQEHPEDKFNRVDMLVHNSKGELMIIEVQNNYEADYLLRMLYGVSKAVTEHIKKGKRYGTIRKIYHINIVYFRMGDGKDYVYHGITEFRGIHHGNFLILDEEQKKFFMKKDVKDLFPEYYLLCVCDFDDLAENSLDEWMYYLKNTEIPESFTAQGLAEAREQLRYDNLSDEEKRAYDHHMQQTLYEQNSLDDSFSKGRSEGEAIGLEKGEAIGLEKGRAEEKAKGEQEKAAAIADIARKALKIGMPIEDVINMTGLSREQIQSILDK